MVLYSMYNKIATYLCFALFLGLLTACSPEGILHLKLNESSGAKVSEKPNNSQKNNGISSPIAIPPSFKNHPSKPGQSNTVYMPNGLPALKPMMGINADTLFSEKIKNDGDRFNRVENAVVDLRKEFEVYKPSIVRLAAVESDIQNLIKELEVLLQDAPNDQSPINLITSSEEYLTDTTETSEPIEIYQPPIKNIPPPPKIIESPPEVTTAPPIAHRKKAEASPNYNGVIAKDLRAGEHADKVRIVIDTNERTKFNIDIDNEEKLIIIELPDARWISSKSKIFEDSALLESYSIEPLNDGKGSMIILSLQKSTSIMQENRLSPTSNMPYHRIYFDLKP